MSETKPIIVLRKYCDGFRCAQPILRAREIGDGMPRTVEQIISGAEQNLQTAKLGLADLRDQPQRRRSGLMNAIIFGRIATFSLQNLSSLLPEFDEWYKEKQDAMRADPLMTYFNELRRKIEHEAHIPGAIVADHIRIDGRKLNQQLGPAPPGAKTLFIGDENGLSGWKVVLPDGGVQKYYVDLPAEIGTIQIALEAPGYQNLPTADIVALYLSRVAAIIAEARQKFIQTNK